MTHQALLFRTMNEAAMEGLDASLDCHGSVIEPAEAYEFVRSLWESTEDRRALMLPEQMPVTFKLHYRAHAAERVAA